MKTVIFACVHNAGRSQMAAAFLNAMADPRKVRAVSAGTQPGERIHPEVQAAMAEVGIDQSGAKPQRLTDELAQGAHWLITMGCGDACPYVPGLTRDDWPLEDPKAGVLRELKTSAISPTESSDGAAHTRTAGDSAAALLRGSGGRTVPPMLRQSPAVVVLLLRSPAERGAIPRSAAGYSHPAGLLWRAEGPAPYRAQGHNGLRAPS